jgi:hypothetical protein
MYTLEEHPNRSNVDPDIYQMGIQTFIDNNSFGELFKFITIYVRRLYSDAYLQKKMKTYYNKIFSELITPSDIANIIALIKNGKGMWDQDDRWQQILMEVVRRRYAHYSLVVKVRKGCLERVCGQGRDWITSMVHGREALEEGVSLYWPILMGLRGASNRYIFNRHPAECCCGQIWHGVVKQEDTYSYVISTGVRKLELTTL